MGVGENGRGEMRQRIGEKGVGEMAVDEIGVNIVFMVLYKMSVVQT